MSKIVTEGYRSTLVPSQGYNPGKLFPVQSTTLPTFFSGFADVLNAAEVFGSKSVDYAIYPDSDIKWPANPPPFSLIIPATFPVSTEHIGGGRFEKTFETHFKIRIIVMNVYDMAYKDSILVTSADDLTAPYVIVHNTINAIEQSYVTDTTGKLILIEFPYSERISSPQRYKGSNTYSFIDITFRIKLLENLPSNLP